MMRLASSLVCFAIRHMRFLVGGRRRVAVGRRDVFVYGDQASGEYFAWKVYHFGISYTDKMEVPHISSSHIQLLHTSLTYSECNLHFTFSTYREPPPS